MTFLVVDSWQVLHRIDPCVLLILKFNLHMILKILKNKQQCTKKS